MRSYVYRDTRPRRDGERPLCITYEGLDHKLHRERTQARTLAQARQLLRLKVNEIIEARANGRRHLRTQTVREYLPTLLNYVKAQCKPEQARRVESTFRLHILPDFGSQRLDQINTGMIQRYVNKRLRMTRGRKKKPVAPATVRLELFTFSALFREAGKERYVAYNPCRGVRIPRFDNRVERFLSDQEEHKLLAASCHGLRTFIRLAVQAGMRKTELLELPWGEVDFSRRVIRLPGNRTKGVKPRDIGINDDIHEILMEIGPSLEADKKVLLNPDTGKPWTSIEDLFDRAVIRSGIKHCRIHDLRHTCASRLAQAGVPLGEIMEFLGHSDIRTTMRYAHFAREHVAHINDALTTKARRRRTDATKGKERSA